MTARHGDPGQPGGLPRVAVVLDFGAASPLNILAAARRLCEVVFACDRDLPFVRGALADVASFGLVCDITGTTTAQAAGRLERLGVAGLTTFSEAQVARTAELAGECGLRYLSRLAATAVTDKLIQRQLLASTGVQATRCQVVHDVAGLVAALPQVGLPAVIKPRSGAGGAFTCRVDTVAQAAARLAEFLAAASPPGAFVVEQLLPGDPTAAGPEWGDYVSVESVTVGGRTSHVELTGKFPLTEPFRETGYLVPATLGEDLRREVLALAGAAVAALGITDAVTHAEVKLTPAGPRIIEVNGRLGGYVADIVRRARGLDLVRMVLAAALGQAPAQPLPGYRRHAFQYFVLPPVQARRLRRFDGVAELSRQPGIHLVETFRRVGEPIDWRDGTLSYLGIVHGSGHSHQDVLRLAGLAGELLKIEYETG